MGCHMRTHNLARKMFNQQMMYFTFFVKYQLINKGTDLKYYIRINFFQLKKILFIIVIMFWLLDYYLFEITFNELVTLINSMDVFNDTFSLQLYLKPYIIGCVNNWQFWEKLKLIDRNKNHSRCVSNVCPSRNRRSFCIIKKLCSHCVNLFSTFNMSEHSFLHDERASICCWVLIYLTVIVFDYSWKGTNYHNSALFIWTLDLVYQEIPTRSECSDENFECVFIHWNWILLYITIVLNIFKASFPLNPRNC